MLCNFIYDIVDTDILSKKLQKFCYTIRFHYSYSNLKYKNIKKKDYNKNYFAIYFIL